MKKRFFEIIFLVLMTMILVSCNSCTPSSAQVAKNDITDTIKTISFNDTINLIVMTGQDTTKKSIIIKKKIDPMEIDTVKATQREIIFEQLEKTQVIIQEQQKQIDSMIVVKKK